jgi:hypothetical protein
MPTASPMSSMDTAVNPWRATRSAAAIKIRSLRAGSRVRPVLVAVTGPPFPVIAASRHLYGTRQ